MSAPEKYTLPLVRDIVLSHGARLGMAGEALGVTEGKDPEVLAMLGDRALKAADDLFAIANVRGVQGHDVVPEFSDEDLWHVIDSLPTLVMAIDAACADPHAMCSISERWQWCNLEASRISSGLIDWAVAHDVHGEAKDVERIKLKYDITGIGRSGDFLIHNPDHPNPSLRLVRLQPMDEARLPEIKERIHEVEDYFADDGESLLESLLS